MIRNIVLLTLAFHVSMSMKCATRPSTPIYHKIERCHRSKLSITARASLSTLHKCKKFGIEKKALAINFSPHRMNSRHLEYNCEVLKCAEAEGGLSLSNDTSFDYYSLYARPLPKINSTCVPAAGMFLIVPKKLNYTESEANCKNMSAVLADVTDEQRTDSLSQALAAANVDAAYVGMKRSDDKKFLVENGNSLECITYRAWAPGHPHRNLNISCVILTKQRTWKTVACKDKYQVFCELLPGGPYTKDSIFSFKFKNDTDYNTQ